jgi:hypothetical protein
MSLQVKRLSLATIGAGTDWEMPVHGFLVTHPGGAVLVDTGVGDLEKVPADWRVVNRSVADALGEHDMTPGDTTPRSFTPSAATTQLGRRSQRKP